MTARAMVSARRTRLMPTGSTPRLSDHSRRIAAKSGQARWLFDRITMPSPVSGTRCMWLIQP